MSVICISDTHWTDPNPASNSLWPRQIKAMGDAGPAFYERMRQEIQRAAGKIFDFLVSAARISERRWNTLVSLGDLSGGYQESGCAGSPWIRETMRGSVHGWLDSGCIDEILFVWGDHDLGYTHHGALPGSGFSLASMEFIESEFGDLFWRKKIEGIDTLCVCSPLALYDGLDPHILVYKKMHRDFVADTLRSLNGQPWQIFIHRPDALMEFDRDFHYGLKAGDRENLVRIVYSHYHNPSSGRWYQRWARFCGILLGDSAIKLVAARGIMCPSVAPLWWRGYGMMVDYKQVLLDPPEYADLNLPMTNFWKCAWWMIRPR